MHQLDFGPAVATLPDPTGTAAELLELALRCGARDNVSVIVVDVGPTDVNEPTIPMQRAWR